MKIEDIFPVPQNYKFVCSICNGKFLIHRYKNSQSAITVITTTLNEPDGFVCERKIRYFCGSICILSLDLRNEIWLRIIENEIQIVCMMIGRTKNM